MKSDTATIEARRNRLLELLSDGKSEAQAAEVLRAEGYPASHDTVGRDVDKLAIGWRKTNAEAFEMHRSTQLTHLADLREQLANPGIKPDRKIELALSILDREIELLGTKAPSKSITAHVNSDVDAASMRLWQRAVYELRHIPEAKLPGFWERVKPIIAELEERETILDASYYPPKLALPAGETDESH